MDRTKFVLLSAFAGFVIPLLIIALSFVISFIGITSNTFGMVAWILWPSAIYYLELIKGVINGSLFFGSFMLIMLNVIMYTFAGGIIWYGRYKQRFVLYGFGTILLGWILFVLIMFNF
ncbi:hypothetical protein LCGC14_1702790 [marine sediment metagenome]|uniref:Uncharacterized protein n=1 Tax=marine sediment metagenome TaxID=412755 RepID=A0A0F9KHH5_9ZZZZ